MKPPASPQLRFLLRASPLLMAMLALWWWLFLGPLLAGLRLSTDAALHLLPGDHAAAGVTIGSDGDWLFQVPVPEFVMRGDKVQRAFGRAPGAPPVRVRSFKLSSAKGIPIFFTLTFPLYGAMLLAAGRTRRWVRAVVGGNALLALLATLSLLLYAIYTIGTRMQFIAPGSVWGAAEYLNINVVSYLAPFLLVLWLHGELRARIFGWEVPALPDPPATDKPRRGRFRSR